MAHLPVLPASTFMLERGHGVAEHPQNEILFFLTFVVLLLGTSVAPPCYITSAKLANLMCCLTYLKRSAELWMALDP